MSKPNGIKSLRPSKQSRYKQGYVNPKSLHKLFESQTNQSVIYRSSYEKRFIQWLEASPRIRAWGSECVKIKYLSPIDGQMHSYYPDYLVEFTDGTRSIVEIKPYNQTVKPDARCTWAVNEFKKNVAKWMAAKQFCEQNNMSFKILTEHTISRLPID